MTKPMPDERPKQPGRARRVWIPLPDRGFDPTEVAVPWKLLTRAGHEVVFATEDGKTVPQADVRLLEGVLFGMGGAEEEPKAFYREMEASPELRNPTPWAKLDVAGFDGLLLPGGHAPGMKQYLGSRILQTQVANFFRLKRPVGAICRGVLVAARATDIATGKSVIASKRTTALPKYMEVTAFLLTFWRLGRYYRTYPKYVEDEVKAALDSPTQFIRGPLNLGDRGTATDDRFAFVVEDGHYLSARWRGDAYLFARRFLKKVETLEDLRAVPTDARADLSR